MKRRDVLASAALLGTAAGWSGAARAEAPRFAEGTDYQVLAPRAAVEAPAGKVEIVEFFWYSCPHCNAFEPTLQAWLRQLPTGIYFRRIPVAFRADFVPQQRLFFALEAMGLVEKMQARVFAAIHTEHLELAQEAQIIDWAGKSGIDKARFADAFHSPAVSDQAVRAAQLQDAYRVEGVPALGVAGRFYTDGALAGGMERALKVVEYLTGVARHTA